ncbi:MAG TPA: helix-turn-helix domain-containing protein [Candidatus Binataceae bacterium]|nr:helix-turn-helix domain-containing protein [Candidatus Binataceae bacterium]
MSHLRVEMRETTAIVADFFHVTIRELHNRRRTNPHVETARMYAVYFCRQRTGASLHQLGDFFRRDHSTCNYHVELVKKLIAGRDREVARHVSSIVAQLTRLMPVPVLAMEKAA